MHLVRNWDAQQEVSSQERSSEVSSAGLITPHPSDYCLNSLPPPFSEKLSSMKPEFLVPKSLGIAAVIHDGK